MKRPDLTDADGKYIEPVTTTDVHPDMKVFLMPGRVIAATCPFCKCMLRKPTNGSIYRCECSKGTEIYRPLHKQGSPEEETELARPMGMLYIAHRLSKDLKAEARVDYYAKTTKISFHKRGSAETDIQDLEIPAIVHVESELLFRKKMNLYIKLS